jgi:hypothetical protein
MLIEHVILAEFDIDQGSGVRLQYPDPVQNVNPEDIAEQMITEGAHNFGVVKTFFTLKHRSCKDLCLEQNRMLQNPQSVFLEKLLTAYSIKRLQENFWLP